MQETALGGVEEILAVIGAVEHCRAGILALEKGDQVVENLVGIEDGVVVGVADKLGVSGAYGNIVVGKEYGHLAGIALVVAEVRAVGVEDEEELVGAVVVESLEHNINQLAVVVGGVEVDQTVGIVGQKIDHSSLRGLVGDEVGCEARLVEECGKTRAAEQLVVLGGVDG